jgi:hypothetical protein
MRGVALILTFVLIPALVLAAPTLNIDSIAGVYKDRFPNSTVDDGKFTSENILEVVKISPNRAYVRTHLEFYNGHLCSFHGIANVEGFELVYRKPTKAWVFGGKGKPQREIDAVCILSLKRERNRLVFEDKDDVCRASMCGARGILRDAAFDLKSRRTIRYMPRLLASREYAEAISESKSKDQPRDRQ